MTLVDHEPVRDVPHAGCVRAFLGRYATAEERNRHDFGDYEGVYRRSGDEGCRGRIVCLETAGVRIANVSQRGSLDMDGAWRDDAPAVAFAWGTGNAVDGTPPPAPSLLVWGPGSTLRIRQRGTSRNIRVGLRGGALEAAMADPRLDGARRRWLRADLMRPRVPPTVEWHLQERVLATARFTERAVEQGLLPEHALRVAAEEVVAAVVATLAAVDRETGAAEALHVSRARLVAKAVERMEGAVDEPVSIAAVCRELAVSRRTLQRAFDDILGLDPRAYERERRLRRVHGAILAEGDHRSITDIAMSFGFWHLGRFAGAYAALYGCSPSETRRRVWHHGAPSVVAGSG